MAIDDSTIYELTGAQVKDLANKIKGKAADNTFVGATSSAPGSKGLVPQPQAGDDTKFLSGDGTWKAVGSGANSVTYYLQKQSTAGMSGFRTYIYTDSGRTTPADPATLVANFVAGKTVLLEYEQTGATEPYAITFHVNSASANGDPAIECQYKLLISELNEDTLTYNTVTTQLSTVVTAGTTFNGRWTLSRAVIPTVPYCNYALGEMPTNTTWIDGKPIYKKTVDIGSLPNATTKSVAHGISNLGLVIKAEGFASESSGVRITFPFASVAAVGDQVAIRFEATNIVILTNVNRSAFSGYVTLYYTKTTD